MENFGFVMATKALIDEKLKVGYMYREEPDNSQDSGWRFFSGTECQKYVDNPDNLGVYDISTIIKIDKDIVPFLDSDYGTVFERENDNGEFKKTNR